MTCPGPEALAALLDAGPEPGLAAHTASCPRCAAEVVRLRAGVAALRAGSPAPEPSPYFAARLAARLAAAPAPARGLRRLLGLPGFRLAVLGAAAALVLAVAGGVVSSRRARARAIELAAAERLELYEDLEVVAGLGDVESAEDAAVVADLGAPEGRP